MGIVKLNLPSLYRVSFHNLAFVVFIIISYLLFPLFTALVIFYILLFNSVHHMVFARAVFFNLNIVQIVFVNLGIGFYANLAITRKEQM